MMAILNELLSDSSIQNNTNLQRNKQSSVPTHLSLQNVHFLGARRFLNQRLLQKPQGVMETKQRDRSILGINSRLPTYPSPKSALTLTSHLGQNVGVRGGVGKLIRIFFLHPSPLNSLCHPYKVYHADCYFQLP